MSGERLRKLTLGLDGSQGEPVVLSVSGRLTVQTVGKLERILDELLRREASVLLGLAEVDAIDLFGLELLGRCRNRFADAGRQLQLGAVSAQVARMIELAGAGRLLLEGQLAPPPTSPNL